MTMAGTHPDGRPKSVVVLGAGDFLGHRVTRALIASGHDVTIAVSGDNVHDWSGTSHRVIPLEDPDALRRGSREHAPRIRRGTGARIDKPAWTRPELTSKHGANMGTKRAHKKRPRVMKPQISAGEPPWNRSRDQGI